MLWAMSRAGVLGHDVPLSSDNPWQRQARLLQSEWRERQGLRPGLHRGHALGSRLQSEDGEPPAQRNYLTPAAKRQVLTAVEDAPSTGALLSRPRLWVDLLSSQPLCFNAFGDLAEDLDLATATFSALMPDLIDRVDAVQFEFSPGRGSAAYTGNRSAFDVFVEASGPTGRGFVGIEVKYHEDMKVKPASHRGYEVLARQAGIYREDAIPRLLEPPLQQLLLDHLLAQRFAAAHPERWNWGLFALLYPLGNTACGTVLDSYRSALADSRNFRAVMLENFIGALRAGGGESLAAQLARRYLGAKR
jgi:hypothetical protein